MGNVTAGYTAAARIDRVCRTAARPRKDSRRFSVGDKRQVLTSECRAPHSTEYDVLKHRQAHKQLQPQAIDKEKRKRVCLGKARAMVQSAGAER